MEGGVGERTLLSVLHASSNHSPQKKHFLGTLELEMPSDNLIFKTQACC